MNIIHILQKQVHSTRTMLQNCRTISQQRKEILQTINLQHPDPDADSESTKQRRIHQINEYIKKLQENTSSQIELLKLFTLNTIKKNHDIYEIVYEKLQDKFKKDFQNNIRDFDTDFVRQTNEAYLNILNNFSQRAHLNARKQILMKPQIIVDDQGKCSFDKISHTRINDVKMMSGNSRHKNSEILDLTYNQIDSVATWDLGNLILIKRDPIPAITIILKAFWEGKMIGSFSEFNRSQVCRETDVKTANENIANELGLPINDKYLLFPKTPWFIGKGDEASGVKKIPVEYCKKALFFFWAILIMSNDLSQSRHAAIATVISGLTAKSQLIVNTIQKQVHCVIVIYCYKQLTIKFGVHENNKKKYDILFSVLMLVVVEF